MDEKKAVGLEELKPIIERIKVLDWKFKIVGAGIHRYRSHPLSNAELEWFENELGLRLPEDYRQFLQIIGYGAGPYTGLASPTEILAELREEKLCDRDWIPNPSRPFPFNRGKADESYRKMSDRRWGGIWTAFPTDGCIPICLECNCPFWTYLVTVGELAGSLWSHGDGSLELFENGEWQEAWNLAPKPLGILRLHTNIDYSKLYVPVYEPALSPFPTFLEWYRAWIDRCLLDLEERKRQGLY
jgi:hypothetical protein